MNRRTFSFLGTACLLAVLATTTQPAPAQSYLTNTQFLIGTYAVQFTGTVFLPAPFNMYNGPFARNGKVTFDGLGNMQANVVANYNGTVSNDSFTGTYVVNSDQTFVITIQNLPIPAIPAGIPTTFTFNGILADNGRQAKIILSGVSVGGQAQPNIGSVITGELLKQFHPLP